MSFGWQQKVVGFFSSLTLWKTQIPRIAKYKYIVSQNTKHTDTSLAKY